LNLLRSLILFKSKLLYSLLGIFSHFFTFGFCYWGVTGVLGEVMLLCFSIFLVFLDCDLHVCWDGCLSWFYSSIFLKDSIPSTFKRGENKLL
jgi:hypothetical protein